MVYMHSCEQLTELSVTVAMFIVPCRVAEKVKKGKDVELYSAFHVQDTSNAHFVTETEPTRPYLGHRTACKHSPAQ